MDPLDIAIGDIARDHPGATRVFLRHRLDFGSGGRDTLRDACARAGIDPGVVAREIAEETTPEPGWGTRTSSELVEHIVSRYHEGLRRDVPAIIASARRVERVHARKPDVPAGLADELAEWWSEMQEHMAKEEQVLFPMLAADVSGAHLYVPVRVMEREHEEHSRRMVRIAELTNQLVAPAHAGESWRALYEDLAMIGRELMHHVHLENNVLFPRARGAT